MIDRKSSEVKYSADHQCPKQNVRMKYPYYSPHQDTSMHQDSYYCAQHARGYLPPLPSVGLFAGAADHTPLVCSALVPAIFSPPSGHH